MLSNTSSHESDKPLKSSQLWVKTVEIFSKLATTSYKSS